MSVKYKKCWGLFEVVKIYKGLSFLFVLLKPIQTTENKKYLGRKENLEGGFERGISGRIIETISREGGKLRKKRLEVELKATRLGLDAGGGPH